MTARLFLLVVAVTALAAAIVDEGEPDGTLIVFAASSLTEAFTEMGRQYEEVTGVEVVLVTGGSSSLREQVLDGAPASVLASANESIMADLASARHIDGEPEVFARNRLVIGVPRGNPLGIRRMADLNRPGLKLGVCVVGVPCGELAQNVLGRLGDGPEVISTEPNVKAVLAKLVGGDLDAGLVYASDVATDDGEIEALPLAQIDVSTSYPIGVVADSPNPKAAREFLAWVMSPAGQSVLEAHGFEAG